MVAAQDAMKARKWQGSARETARSEAVPGTKSQFDLFHISEIKGYVYTNLNRMPTPRVARNRPQFALHAQAKKLSREAAGGFVLGDAQLPEGHRLRQPRSQDIRDPDMQVQVARAYYLSGNNKESVRVMNQLLASIEQGARSEGATATADSRRLRTGRTTPASQGAGEARRQHPKTSTGST